VPWNGVLKDFAIKAAFYEAEGEMALLPLLFVTKSMEKPSTSVEWMSRGKRRKCRTTRKT